jgi:hypothetical protein
MMPAKETDVETITLPSKTNQEKCGITQKRDL